MLPKKELDTHYKNILRREQSFCNSIVAIEAYMFAFFAKLFCMKNGANATSSITLGAADNTSRLRLIYHDMTIESTRLPYTPGEAAWTFQARNPQRQDEVDQIIAAVDCPHEGFAGFCAAVADALDGRSGAEVSLKDAIGSIELAAAIYHSDRSGQRVTLPIDRIVSTDTALYVRQGKFE